MCLFYKLKSAFERQSKPQSFYRQGGLVFQTADLKQAIEDKKSELSGPFWWWIFAFLMQTYCFALIKPLLTTMIMQLLKKKD